MKHLTFNEALKLYYGALDGKVDPKRKPNPFPGRGTPTRVAYSITVGYAKRPKTIQNPKWDGEHGPQYILAMVPTKFHKLQYVGKPNRYRALEALRWLSRKTVVRHWQIEFDRSGVVAMKQVKGTKVRDATSLAYVAYHPHSSNIDIVGSFAKPVYVKRIGRMSVYSNAKKLSIEKVEAFYDWYEKSFGRKLRKPKQKPLETGTIEPPEPELEEIPF